MNYQDELLDWPTEKQIEKEFEAELQQADRRMDEEKDNFPYMSDQDRKTISRM